MKYYLREQTTHKGRTENHKQVAIIHYHHKKNMLWYIKLGLSLIPHSNINDPYGFDNMNHFFLSRNKAHSQKQKKKNHAYHEAICETKCPFVIKFTHLIDNIMQQVQH